MNTNKKNTLRLNFRDNYDFFGYNNKETIHWGKLYIRLFDCPFSTYTAYHDFNVKTLFNELKKIYQVAPENIITNITPSSKSLFRIEYDCSEIFLILKPGFCIAITEHLFYLQYNSQIHVNEIFKLLRIANKHKIAVKPIRKFYMVQYDADFSLLDFDVTPCNINIPTHYNDDFQEIDNTICTALKANNKNGLILLHGKYGTGKTYYLRHLINTIGREFIYFPLNMIEALSSPSFLPFLATHKESVLILEDCESILIKRENEPNNSSALSNLLNLGDGLLADALNINIICTFNTGVNNIDNAILRKGRLIACYEFKELEAGKAQQLSNSLGQRISVSNPMTVSEIYNLNSLGFESKKKNPIGFK